MKKIVNFIEKPMVWVVTLLITAVAGIITWVFKNK